MGRIFTNDHSHNNDQEHAMPDNDEAETIESPQTADNNQLGDERDELTERSTDVPERSAA
ncbi:hypothetical protein ACH41E_18830 [Streptomyces sp. NPDC020412]|uniref:hypothetical protein n=1 Tax=Streptomyces sp. NPDC020412 TaxID=3365073 RepID=UPI0037B674E5